MLSGSAGSEPGSEEDRYRYIPKKPMLKIGYYCYVVIGIFYIGRYTAVDFVSVLVACKR